MELNTCASCGGLYTPYTGTHAATMCPRCDMGSAGPRASELEQQLDPPICCCKWVGDVRHPDTLRRTWTDPACPHHGVQAQRAAECVPLADAAAVVTLQQARQAMRNAAIQCEAAAKVIDALIRADEIASIRATQDADPRYQSGGGLQDFRVSEGARHE